MNRELLDLFGKQRSPELDISRLPGFIRDYLQIATRNTDARPGLLLTAWLPFCAVNAGNRVYMVSNATRKYANIWSCVIGPSSVSRKSTALRYAGYTLKPYEDELRNVPLETYEARTMILGGVSLSKMMSYLAENPNRLFVHHEFSGWLAEMNRNYNIGYKQTVTELFDNVDRTLANRERTERIVNPALSIAASSTEGWFYKNMMDGAEQLSGFLQRMLFYVVRGVNLEEMELENREAGDLEAELAAFDGLYFSVWRQIPGSQYLRVGEAAAELRNELYPQRFQRYYQKFSDSLMSYFTRIYDNYWFKFCILFTLARHRDALRGALRPFACEAFFQTLEVDAETAEQAFYLCDFYMTNTIPLLNIIDEQDKLSGERKLVEILLNKYGGKAKHSELMNACHMRKREFRECVESLIEREAITVGTFGSGNHVGRMYVLANDIIESWSK
jgi:hypothetical protein